MAQRFIMGSEVKNEQNKYTNMQRRKLIVAISVIMGVSGCIEDQETSITKETAMENFTDIKKFESPNDSVVDHAVRFTDEEAGQVFWAFRHSAAASGSSSQLELTSSRA